MSLFDQVLGLGADASPVASPSVLPRYVGAEAAGDGLLEIAEEVVTATGVTTSAVRTSGVARPATPHPALAPAALVPGGSMVPAARAEPKGLAAPAPFASPLAPPPAPPAAPPVAATARPATEGPGLRPAPDAPMFDVRAAVAPSALIERVHTEVLRQERERTIEAPSVPRDPRPDAGRADDERWGVAPAARIEGGLRPRAGAPQPAAVARALSGPTAAAETPIEIEIGRIEIRTARPTRSQAAPRVLAARPRVSLDDYLKGRRRG